jgi:hypothetical protein
LQFDETDEITWNLYKNWKVFTIGVKFLECREHRNLTSVLLQDPASNRVNFEDFSSLN